MQDKPIQNKMFGAAHNTLTKLQDLEAQLASYKQQLLYCDARNGRVRLKQEIAEIERKIRLVEGA